MVEKNFIDIQGHLILGLQNLSATCGLKYFWVYRWVGIYVVMRSAKFFAIVINRQYEERNNHR